MINLILIITGILLGALGAICLKLASPVIVAFKPTISYIFYDMFLNPYVFFGFALYFIPGIIWMYLLSKYPVSFLQPILALTYVVTPLMALLLLHEPIPALRWLGILVICIGITIISYT